jgi:hypothetical protein
MDQMGEENRSIFGSFRFDCVFLTPRLNVTCLTCTRKTQKVLWIVIKGVLCITYGCRLLGRERKEKNSALKRDSRTEGRGSPATETSDNRLSLSMMLCVCLIDTKKRRTLRRC